MRNERGMSLAEVTVVMVVVAIIATAAATYTIPWLGREEMRGAVYQVQQFLQLSRAQAITRNRACRFQIDTASRRITVYDLNDPASTTDDILLHDASSGTLPEEVAAEWVVPWVEQHLQTSSELA